MKQYVELLRNNTTLRRLSIIQLISYFGAWFSHMGIYTLLIQLDAPVWALSAAAGFTFLPSMLLAPFSGAIIDKIDTKKFMLLLTAIEIVTVFWLMFITSLDALWILLGLIFIRMGTGSIYFQTEMSLLPKLLNNDELKLANEIHSMIWSISYAFGMAVAGFYIHYFGTTSAFVADMVLYCISFYLLLGLNIPSIASKHALHVKAMIWSGFVYIKENPKIMHLIFLHASVGLTAYDALIALLADHQYKQFLSIALVMGFINASRALSQVLGQFLLSRYITKETLFYIFIVQGVLALSSGVCCSMIFTSVLSGSLCAGFLPQVYGRTLTRFYSTKPMKPFMAESSPITIWSLWACAHSSRLPLAFCLNGAFRWR